MIAQERIAQLPTDRHITFQQQKRSCGKTGCKKCSTGQKHGLYWYAYWHERPGKLKSKYIGKELPEQEEEHHGERLAQ